MTTEVKRIYWQYLPVEVQHAISRVQVILKETMPEIDGVQITIEDDAPIRVLVKTKAVDD